MILLRWYYCEDITAMILLRWYYCNDITAIILLQWYYCNDITAMKLLQWYYCNDITDMTAMILLQWYYCNDITAMILLQCYPFDGLTSPKKCGDYQFGPKNVRQKCLSSEVWQNICQFSFGFHKFFQLFLDPQMNTYANSCLKSWVGIYKTSYANS